MPLWWDSTGRTDHTKHSFISKLAEKNIISSASNSNKNNKCVSTIEKVGQFSIYAAEFWFCTWCGVRNVLLMHPDQSSSGIFNRIQLKSAFYGLGKVYKHHRAEQVFWVCWQCFFFSFGRCGSFYVKFDLTKARNSIYHVDVVSIQLWMDWVWRQWREYARSVRNCNLLIKIALGAHLLYLLASCRLMKPAACSADFLEIVQKVHWISMRPCKAIEY